MKEIIKAHYTPFDISQKVWLEGTNLTLSYNKKIKTKCEGPFKVVFESPVQSGFLTPRPETRTETGPSFFGFPKKPD